MVDQPRFPNADIPNSIEAERDKQRRDTAAQMQAEQLQKQRSVATQPVPDARSAPLNVAGNRAMDQLLPGNEAAHGRTLLAQVEAFAVMLRDAIARYDGRYNPKSHPEAPPHSDDAEQQKQRNMAAFPDLQQQLPGFPAAPAPMPVGEHREAPADAFHYVDGKRVEGLAPRNMGYGNYQPKRVGGLVEDYDNGDVP